MTSPNRIAELASIITENTAIVDEYLSARDLPTPSFDIDAPAKLPIADDALEVEAARAAVIDATGELQALMLGPMELLTPIVRPEDTRARGCLVIR